MQGTRKKRGVTVPGPSLFAEDIDTRPRILVVDDDDRNLLAISTVLEDLGKVVVARSGEEALRHLLRHEFAVILLDVYMPGMDGYETAQVIREREQTKRIPIVLLSAVHKETEHLLRGYSMGAVDYIFKPVESVVLRSKVAVFVDLFAKTKEIERKAQQEQALLDENLQANTERLRVERELRRAESQLFQAQKMDAIGKLTGGIAHDFNNLLAAVIGGLDLIERRASLSEPSLEILGMTRRAAEQGTELVRRMLAFARRQQLQPTEVEVASLAKSVSGLLGPTMGGFHQIEWEIAKGLWHAFVDPAQLELALMNLVINARDAMDDGGTIRISAENTLVERAKLDGLRPGHYVVLTVSDTGCGIPEEMIEQVLEPFVTTKDIGKGTGLGLSMVYGFAKQSNGAFKLSSKAGVGTEAAIWLPRAAKSDKRKSDSGGRKALRQSRPLRILLVDDHDEVRATTAGMLEELGHRVGEAGNAIDALTILRHPSSGWDLLITDYAMPSMSGIDLLNEARRHNPGLPAMIITGYAETRAIGDRPDDVVILPKPFTLEELSQVIALLTPKESVPAEFVVGVK